MSMGSAPAGAQIAGFWRRLFAAFVDSLILGVPALFVGYLLFDQLSELGQNGRAIGAVISLAYFGILNSSVGGGQTLGKRMLGVRVVGASGEPIGLPRAVIRTVILLLPFYLNGFDMSAFAGLVAPAESMLPAVVAMVLVFGFGLAMIYLYIFNRKTRQSLHDLFVETYVVRANEGGAVDVRVWPVHVAIALALITGGFVLPAYVGTIAKSVATDDEFAAMEAIQKDVMVLPYIRSVSVQQTRAAFISSKTNTSTTFLDVEVSLKKRTSNADPMMKEIAGVVLKRAPDLLGNEQLRIGVAAGFDIGIARATEKKFSTGTADEWRKIVEGLDGAKPLEVHSSFESMLTNFVDSAEALIGAEEKDRAGGGR